MKPSRAKAIHIRIRPGSALERFMARMTGKPTDAIHELAAKAEGLEGAKNAK